MGRGMGQDTGRRGEPGGVSEPAAQRRRQAGARQTEATETQRAGAMVHSTTPFYLEPMFPRERGRSVRTHLRSAGATRTGGLRSPQRGRIVGWLLAVGAVIGLTAFLGPGAASAGMNPMMPSSSPEEIQEVILRVKPSVVLISVKVDGEATVSCGEKSTKTVSLSSRDISDR